MRQWLVTFRGVAHAAIALRVGVSVALHDGEIAVRDANMSTQNSRVKTAVIYGPIRRAYV
jgi:hypothetical protein